MERKTRRLDPQRRVRTGEIHIVQCVRARVPASQEPQWWPIAGPWHEDRRWIRFDQHHYHVDWRFVERERIEKVVKAERGFCGDGHGQLIAGQVITAQLIVPEPYRAKRARADVLPPGPRDAWMRALRRRCVDEWPVSWHESENWTDWIKDLEHAFEAKHLVRKGDRIFCPHKAMELSDRPVEEDGTIECPLHGLRWCIRTGRLKLQEDWQ